MLQKSIKNPVISYKFFALKLNFIFNREIEVKLEGNCLIHVNNISLYHRNVVNLSIDYQLDKWSR